MTKSKKRDEVPETEPQIAQITQIPEPEPPAPPIDLPPVELEPLAPPPPPPDPEPPAPPQNPPGRVVQPRPVYQPPAADDPRWVFSCEGRDIEHQSDLPEWGVLAHGQLKDGRVWAVTKDGRKLYFDPVTGGRL